MNGKFFVYFSWSKLFQLIWYFSLIFLDRENYELFQFCVLGERSEEFWIISICVLGQRSEELWIISILEHWYKIELSNFLFISTLCFKTNWYKIKLDWTKNTHFSVVNLYKEIRFNLTETPLYKKFVWWRDMFDY